MENNPDIFIGRSPMVIFDQNTDYYKVGVIESKNKVRYLKFRALDPYKKLLFTKDQSAVDLTNLRQHVYSYSLLAMYSLLFVPNPSNILVVGLGAGVVPREMSHYFPSANIDVIEIDKVIVDVAQKYFLFETSDKVKIHVGDAFSVIDTLDKKYDIVFIDAFSEDYMPFPIMSKEFLVKVKGRLSGIVAVNTCNTYACFDSQVNTIAKVFGENIYELIGQDDGILSMIYASVDGIMPTNKLSLPPEYYPDLVPHKFEVTEEIKKAKVFTLTNV